MDDAFGNLVASTGGSSNPYGFTGEPQFGEADSLVFLRARYYQPATGRFLSRDPIEYLAGMNLYTYCENNPVNWIDPLGKYAKVSMDPINNKLYIEIPMTYTGPLAGKYGSKVSAVIEKTWSGTFEGGVTVETKVTTPKPGERTNTIELIKNNITMLGNGQKGKGSSVNRRDASGKFDVTMWPRNWAHEAGHLIGLEDGYDVPRWRITGEKVVIPGYEENIMYNSEFYGVDIRNLADILDLYMKNGTLNVIDGCKK